MKLYQKLVVHYINKRDYKSALEKINMIESAETRNFEMTRYLSVMVKTVPDQCFNSLESEKFRTIDLPKLMPALRNCPERAMRRARMFVENHCINHRKCKDSSVHNMCFYLYAQSENSSEMLDYLRKEENKIIAG